MHAIISEFTVYWYHISTCITQSIISMQIIQKKHKLSTEFGENGK